MKIVTRKGDVVDVTIQYETLHQAKWIPIVRYDCSHGFFHRDVLLPSGGKEKEAIAIERLEDALSYAEQDLRDRWESYKQRYMRRMRQ